MNVRPSDWQAPGADAQGCVRRGKGLTGPEQARLWRRERLCHCIATLLRDPAVARAVAGAVAQGQGRVVDAGESAAQAGPARGAVPERRDPH